MIKKTIKEFLLITTGSISLIMGVIGLFLPLLPTTPFLLLAAYCFLRSSKRLYNWLITHKVFGRYIRDFLEYKEIKPKAKISCLILLWVSIAISVILINFIYVRILLIIIGIAVSTHIMTLKGNRPHPDAKTNNKIEEVD